MLLKEQKELLFIFIIQLQFYKEELFFTRVSKKLLILELLVQNL